jgi:NosR/NirI family transcriptional regulator, nitrous oxide reductase regulator
MMTRHSFSLSLLSLAALLLIAVIGAAPSAALASSRLGEFIGRVTPSELAPGADAVGPVAGDPPAAAVMKGGEVVGYVFLNSDVVDSTGYSGKPISILIALDRAGHITAAKLVEHHEPIVLVGIAESRVVHFIQGYVGRSVVAQDSASTPADLVSGATVSMMVIGDSIMRSSIKVAQARGLGGLSPQAAAAPQAKATIDPNKQDIASWTDLLGDGSVRRLFQSNHDINEAFARTGNAGAIAHPETGPPDAANVDLYLALVSVPSIGRSLLGEAEYQNLARRLKPGQQAVLVAGDGSYSFRGSGYVRGGIFDRIVVIQDETSIRFRDRNYTRVGDLAPPDAPDFPEIGLFVIPEDVAFDPAQPWRLQLLVQRPTGAMDKAFLTLPLGYTTPSKYLVTPAVPPAAPSAPLAAAPPQQADTGTVPIWQRIWLAKIPEILILLTAIGLLTGVFFFQKMLVKHEVLYQRIRLSYLAFTVLWLGWYEHAQLSVVNVFTFFQALRTDFHWDLFLMDPLVFILWCSVAAALLFWGRGAYCGWLCPFGALQEWMSFIAKACRIPQLTVPFGVHERLWPIKYIIFLALFGVSLGSLATAEQLAEIEPFKTAIILHFARDWWFVLLALGLLAPGLFIDRFYCRYMCPLGGALAIPARVRMFDWLRRYRQCGSPCQRCYGECPVQAIHPEGHINPNECIQCLNCQVLYHHDGKCPVMIEKRLKRERFDALSSKSMKPGASANSAKANSVTKRNPAAPASAERP